MAAVQLPRRFSQEWGRRLGEPPDAPGTIRALNMPRSLSPLVGAVKLNQVCWAKVTPRRLPGQGLGLRGQRRRIPGGRSASAFSRPHAGAGPASGGQVRSGIEAGRRPWRPGRSRGFHRHEWVRPVQWAAHQGRGWPPNPSTRAASTCCTIPAGSTPSSSGSPADQSRRPWVSPWPEGQQLGEPGRDRTCAAAGGPPRQPPGRGARRGSQQVL